MKGFYKFYSEAVEQREAPVVGSLPQHRVTWGCPRAGVGVRRQKSDLGETISLWEQQIDQPQQLLVLGVHHLIKRRGWERVPGEISSVVR